MKSDDERCAEPQQFVRIDAAFRAGSLAALRGAVDDPESVPNGLMPLAIGPCLEYAIYLSPLSFIRELRDRTLTMPIHRFRGRMKIFNGNPYVYVSAARARLIKPDWRKALPVLVRINGHPKTKPWRINLMPIGTGAFYLYLHGDVRRASNTKVGDRVRVDIRFDTAYRNGPMHPMPSWFRIPLSKNRKARAAWRALIPSRKKEILRYLSWLKSPEARARNVARALHVLSGKPGRYMARSWD